MICLCRTCGKEYRESTATAEHKGYCRQPCMLEMAKRLGWSKRAEDESIAQDQRGLDHRQHSLFWILHRAKALGSILAPKER